jgi:hypothetical protein
VSSICEAHTVDCIKDLATEMTKTSTSPEMDRFNSALRGALNLSKADLNRLLSEEKVSHNLRQKPGRKPKAANADKPKCGPKVAANKIHNE